MKKKSVHSIFYLVAASLLIAWIFVTIKEWHNAGGWLLMLFFFSLGFVLIVVNFFSFIFTSSHLHICTLPCPVFQVILYRCFGNRQFIDVIIKPFGKILFDLIRPPCINLSCSVFAFSQSLMAEHIS